MDPVDVARGVSDFGMMAVTAAFFLVLAAGMMVYFLKFSTGIMSGIVEGQKQTMRDLLAETRNQNALLEDISEGLREETMSRIRTVSGALFDVGREQMARLVIRVREENNIADRAATSAKIRRLVAVLHNDRNSKFDLWKYRGKPLSAYTDPAWIEKCAAAIEQEVYEKTPNNGRATNNIGTVLENIKLEFYHNLMQG